MFAFGGTPPSVLIPAAAALLVLAVLFPPAVAQSAGTRVLDAGVLFVVAAAGAQCVPLPRGLAGALSPASLPVERAFALVPPAGARAVSIRPSDTVEAWLLLAGAALLFFTARRVFGSGGVRTFTRLAAFAGLALAGVALAQHATARGLMYWRVAPPREGPDPFGPFINRNHFGTWAMMIVPLCIGYLAAHAAAHPRSGGPGWRRRLLAVFDARAWMLIAASMLLLVAVAASLSRSAMIGAASALACSVWLMRRRAVPQEGLRRAGVYGMLVVAAAALGALVQVGPSVIGGRFWDSGTALADRAAIWQDTLPVVRDFWLTGTGAGTFQAAMAVYQRSRPSVIFNQAHNHFLQVAAEGGLLLGVPAAFCLLALAGAGARRLARDRSPIYFLRAGAAAGLAGVAVQSLWETGLTMPANAALAAVLAAILVHERAGTRR